MCQTSAVVIGKPNHLMLEMIAEEMGIVPKDTVIVRDRLYTDIEMAARAGTQSILVFSGETDRGMLEVFRKEPTLIFDSVVNILLLIRRDGHRGRCQLSISLYDSGLKIE